MEGFIGPMLVKTDDTSNPRDPETTTAPAVAEAVISSIAGASYGEYEMAFLA